MKYIVETKNLGKKYKNFLALDNINMHIKSGSIYGLIGKIGAGKTTLMKVLTGIEFPTKGTYSIYGVEYQDKKINETRKRISAMVETPALFEHMTAKENLIYEYKIIGMPSLEGIEELLNIVGLKEVENKKVINFSLGMKQRLGIAIALASNPDFLILDEPINGLDPEGIIDIRELILKLSCEKGITILISSHYLDELSKIATVYGFLHEGKLIEEISAKELNQKLTNMSRMFSGYSQYSISNLQILNLSSFDTSKVTDMNSMFSNMHSLIELNLGENFNTSNVENMSGMFYNLSKLKKLDLGDKFNLNSPKVLPYI